MNKSNDILFSIIIATYNRAGFVNKAIESVISQRYQNWELIIIDDGSNDETEQVVKSFGDIRISYYFQQNKGRSIARNHGIDRSNGAYLNFLDDDDYLLPEFISEFFSEISKLNFAEGAFMCDQKEIDLNGNIIEAKTKIFRNNHPAKFILKYSNNIQPLFISKSILQKERFDPRFEIGEDFHLLFRIVLRYRFYYFPKTLCVYVNHKSMTMEKELKDLLFIEQPYNRLDVLDYFFSEYDSLLEKHNVIRPLSNRYNKIAYFYASMSIKNQRNKFAEKMLNKLKWKGSLLKVIYYKMSIFLRIRYYK